MSSLPVRLVALASLLIGCATSTAIVVPAPGPVTSMPDRATIVVVQPESRLRAVNFIDGRGQLIGQLDERSHTVLHVFEGPTMLYAALGNSGASADRLEGTLIAGRVYYATVSARPGGVALLALTPRSPDGRWAHKADYIARTPCVQMDPELIGRTVNELGNLQPLMEAADARAASLPPSEEAEHHYQENDGF